MIPAPVSSTGAVFGGGIVGADAAVDGPGHGITSRLLEEAVEGKGDDRAASHDRGGERVTDGGVG
jgi:hypothetical protein